MNIDAFTKSLERAFGRTNSVDVRGAEVRQLRKPRPLAPLLEKSLEGDEEREIYSGTFEDWPGNVAEILDEHDLHRSLITLNWDGFGPISWSAGIVAVETGGRAYLCSWDELESYQLHAAVDQQGDTDALREVVVGLLSSGSLVQHVPHYVWNKAPALLDRQTIEDAFAAQLDQTEGWGALASAHFGRIVEPNHLQRCLDSLARLPKLNEMDSWLEELEADDGSELSEAARRAVLREFLDRGYEEIEATPVDESGDDGHSNMRLATQEDLDRIYGSGNLLIGFPVVPPQPSGATSSDDDDDERGAEGGAR
jgi:hypothetical protein